MNQHTASEHVAALKLQEQANSLASSYTKDPQDLAAARLAVLMIACQQEAREQGIYAELVFDHSSPNKQEQKA